MLLQKNMRSVTKHPYLTNSFLSKLIDFLINKSIVILNLINLKVNMSNIINAIIAKAKALKKTQSELAASIGMSPEAFSRAKKRGDMRLSDIQSMATAVGMRVNLLDLPVMTSGTPNIQISRNLRRCELLGLEFPYDWSLGFM